MSVTKVQLGEFKAEHQSNPPRVDVWRGVVWMGQWHWVPETGIGDRRAPNDARKLPRMDEVALGKIAAALRGKGV